METFLVLLAIFIVMPLIAVAYSNGVHKICALVIRMLPARLGRKLGAKLYRNEYDALRAHDAIAAAIHDKDRKTGAAHKGELVD